MGSAYCFLEVCAHTCVRVCMCICVLENIGPCNNFLVNWSLPIIIIRRLFNRK